MGRQSDLEAMAIFFHSFSPNASLHIDMVTLILYFGDLSVFTVFYLGRENILLSNTYSGHFENFVLVFLLTLCHFVTLKVKNVFPSNV